MRLTLIISALALTGCGETAQTAGPERSAAAGEILGGDASDAMLPLESTRSTSPPDPRAGATGDGADGETPGDAASASGTPSLEERRRSLPRPETSGGPEPLPSNPSAEDAPSPPQG